MNADQLRRALAHIDSLTDEELFKRLEAAGFKFVSIHAGKKLSEVPYDGIGIGMEVVGLDGDTGKVDAKWDKNGFCKDNMIRVEWASCSQTSHWHLQCDDVIVA